MAAAPLAGPLPGALQPGSEVLLRYQDPTPEWHARLLLFNIVGDEWVVVTPTADMFVEQVSNANRDLQSWRVRPADRSIPFGVNPAEVFDFQPAPTGIALHHLLAEGQQHGMVERGRRGIAAPAPPLVPPVVPPAGVHGGAPVAGGGLAAQAGGGGGALLGGGLGVVPVVPAGGHAAVVGPPPLAGAGGPGGIHALVAGAGGGGAIGGGGLPPASSADDARTLTISRDQDGNRHKEFRQASLECRETEFTDWPIAGPRTAKWVIQFVAENGGTPLAHHQAWRSACRMQPSDGPVIEHESYSRILQIMMNYDQVDVSNLASAELIVRHLQRIEEKHKDKLVAISDDNLGGETALFMGLAQGSRAGLCVAPALQTWLGKQLQEEALLTKERRKAREERALMRQPKKEKGAKE